MSHDTLSYVTYFAQCFISYYEQYPIYIFDNHNVWCPTQCSFFIIFHHTNIFFVMLASLYFVCVDKKWKESFSPKFLFLFSYTSIKSEKCNARHVFEKNLKNVPSRTNLIRTIFFFFIVTLYSTSYFIGNGYLNIYCRINC